MKYYKNFLILTFCNFKIYITTPMSCISIFSCYMTMISYLSIINQFFKYPACVTWSKIFFFVPVMIKFSLFFNCFFTVFILFKNCFNKSISTIFTSTNNNWFTKFIININKLVRKSARNMILIFFCVKTFIDFNTF